MVHRHYLYTYYLTHILSLPLQLHIILLYIHFPCGCVELHTLFLLNMPVFAAVHILFMIANIWVPRATQLPVTEWTCMGLIM